MNPDEILRITLGPELNRQLAEQRRQGCGVDDVEGRFAALIRIFTWELKCFKTARNALVDLPVDPRRPTIRMPGRTLWLLLDAAEEAQRRDRSSITNRPDEGDPKGAARIVVASCGPRYRRALQLTRAGAQYLRAWKPVDALANLDKPESAGGPYR